MNETDDLKRLVDGVDPKQQLDDEHHQHHYKQHPLSKRSSNTHHPSTITISVANMVFLFLGTMLLGAAVPIVMWETNRQYTTDHINDDNVLVASQSGGGGGVASVSPNDKQMLSSKNSHHDSTTSKSSSNNNSTDADTHLTTTTPHSKSIVVMSNKNKNSPAMKVSMTNLNNTTRTTPTMTTPTKKENSSNTLTSTPSQKSTSTTSHGNDGRIPKRSPGDAPGIAWLMSFPNSGTSFTMNLVTTASNLSQASNYGWERSSTSTNLPVFPGGPYWLQTDWINTTPNSQKNRPVVVLTKTHCGGYCHDCRIRKQIESPHSFLMHCAMSDDFVEDPEVDTIEDNDVPHERVVADGSNHKHNRTFYDYQQVVDRAVHLFRNPLDNIVSRYHLGIHKVVKDDNTDLMERYTYDREGFESFCLDNMDYWDERRDSHIDQSILRMVWEVPCHMDLFRYVQWHNLAFIATDDFLQVPVHIVHYEDYKDPLSFNATLNSLLNFLDLPNTGAVAEFETGKSYRDYFTDKQFHAMRNATMRLASAKTWKHLERYF